MRLHNLLFLSSISFFGAAFGQNIKTANYFFDNFEYNSAITEYEKFDLAKLDNADQQKLGYCYYITANSEKGLPYLDKVAEKHQKEAYYWLWKGSLEKDKGDYQSAINSFKMFKQTTDELGREIDLLINSCEQIPTWDSIPRASVLNSDLNSLRAESLGLYDDKMIYFTENGLDSTGKGNLGQEGFFAELLFMTPNQLENENLVKWINTSVSNPLSFNRIQLFPSTSKVIYSASDVLNKKEVLKNHQIYIADFNAENNSLENSKLWDLIDITDSSSNSHITISPNGQRLVFTKSSRITSGSDLYISNFVSGNWEKPVPISQLNTEGNDMFPLFENDSILQFASDGRIGYGGLDIYKVNLDVENAQIIHYHHPVNSPMDDYNLYWSNSESAQFVSNRLGGKGDDDIWNLTIEKEIIPVVVDDGFKKWVEDWNLKPVYFDFDSFESELNKEFVDGCNKYFGKYKFDVKLVGHTDSRGTPEYNMELGLNRCKWLQNQLKSLGVQNTITLESVGETQLVNKCDSKTKCSDEEHLQNRFVQIFIQLDQTTIE